MFYHLYGIEVYGSTHIVVQFGVFRYFSRFNTEFVQYPVNYPYCNYHYPCPNSFAKVIKYDKYVSRRGLCTLYVDLEVPYTMLYYIAYIAPISPIFYRMEI